MPRKRKQVPLARGEDPNWLPTWIPPPDEVPPVARWRPLGLGEITRRDFRQEGDRWVPAEIGVAATTDPKHLRTLGEGARCWFVADSPIYMVGNGSRAFPFASLKIAAHLISVRAVGIVLSVPGYSLLAAMDPPPPDSDSGITDARVPRRIASSAARGRHQSSVAEAHP